MRNQGVPEFFETTKHLLKMRKVATAEEKAIASDAEKREKNPRVRFVTSKGAIVVELFEDDAPFAVNNLIALAEGGYYERMRFHDVVGSGYAIVGDPRTRPGSAERTDGPKWRLRQDKSPRPPLRGYLATKPVRGNAFHGSQFLILTAPALQEARHFAVFGRIVEGLDVAESLEQDDTMLRVEVISKRNHDYTGLESRFFK